MAAPLVERSTGDLIPASDHNDVKDYIEDGVYRVNTLALEIQGTEVIDSSRVGKFASVELGGTAVTATGTELNYVDGVTSAIQTQIDGKQATDAFLDDIAALTDPNDDRILFWDDNVGDIVWLDLGTGLAISTTTISVDESSLTLDNIGGTLSVSKGGTGSTTASAARTALGLAIGSDVQAWDAILDDLSGLTQAADKIPYFDSSTTAAVLDFLDEDAMGSNSATALASQQSIKAYADTKLANVSEDTTPSLGGDLDAADNDVQNIKLAEFQDEHDNGNSGTSATIDWNNGNNQKITLTGNVTLAFTAPSGPCRVQLRAIQDATGGRTITYPASVKSAGGTAPTLSTAANAEDILVFWYNGTDYYLVGSLDFS